MKESLSDTILSGLLICSVVARDAPVIWNAHVTTVSCKNESWLGKFRFVPADNIFPTVFMSCLFQRETYLPIDMTKNGVVVNENNFIVLLPLSPHKMHMTVDILDKKRKKINHTTVT